MVGLVVAAHGRLAEELVATAEQIVGPIAGVKTIGIEPGSTPEVIRQQMRDAVHSLDSGEGVLVLADLFGGTPCKESLMLIQREHLEVLAGVNLPMLLKAASLRNEHLPLPELALTLAAYTQKNITCASEQIRLAAARVAAAASAGALPGHS
jgi:PTS system mannose-specific IIA component